MKKIKWSTFLYDIFMCSLGSYGGPEAHYGIFSSMLVKKKKYLTEEELMEMIGLFALVPGPSSTQTITAIGYYAGGPILAILTFLVWVLPAMLTMGLIGVFFSQINSNHSWKPIINYLPAVAVSFIVYAGITLSKKVIQTKVDGVLFSVMLVSSLFLVRHSMWVVPILLILGGIIMLIPHLKEKSKDNMRYKPKWFI